MFIKQLHLENYRSYAEKTVEFAPETNVIWGGNAQGKTNLLEAIFLCAVTRSFRSNSEKELAKTGEQGYSIDLLFHSCGRDQSLKIVQTGGKKMLFANGIRQQKRSDFVGRLKCVLFAPEHLSLVKNGPGERRKFLDMSLCQMRPTYYSALIHYQKLLEQKNVLLKKMDNKSGMMPLLQLYNDRLSGYCAQVMQMRRQYLEKLQKYACVCHEEISSGTEKLSLSYLPSIRMEGGESLQQLQQTVQQELERNLERELILRSSQVGCHRDDFEIGINGFDARGYGSQGQQRSCVLSLKMAECDIFKDSFGEYPVLLLDDIMSELDSSRKHYVANRIGGRQVILTCCEKEVFEELEGPNVIRIGGEE